MPRTEPKVPSGQPRLAKSWLKIIGRSEIWFWLVSGLILGRVVILGELYPFLPAMAAVLAVVLPWRRGIGALMALEISFASVSAGSIWLTTALASGLVYGILLWLSGRKLPPAKLTGAIAGLGCFLVKTVGFSLAGLTYYQGFNLLFEALLAAVLTLVLLKLPAAVLAIRLKKSLSGEELVCLFIWAAALIVGCTDLTIGNLRVGQVLSQVIILIAALSGGIGLGAAAGAAMGILPLLASLPLTVAGSAFSGLLAGLGQSWGKKTVLAGLIIGQMILWVYAQSSQEIILESGEMALAALIFILIPSQKIAGLAGWPQGIPSRFSSETEKQVRWAVQENLHYFGSLGQKIAAFWLEESSDDLAAEQQILQRELQEKVCFTCAMGRVCWEKERFRFEEALLNFIQTKPKRPKELPAEVQRRCLKSREISLVLACLQDNLQISRYWQSKMLQSRRFLKEQLEIIEEVWENRLNRLDLTSQTSEQAELLCKQLMRESGFQALQVKIFNREKGAEIAVIAKECGQNLFCRYQAAKVISNLFNRSYRVVGDWCYLDESQKNCSFWLCPELKFYWQVGAAQKSSAPVCGDSYGLTYLPGGRLAAILSDGMGQGAEAARQSQAVVEMLGEFLQFGFSAQEALRTINSLLLLRPEQESFATVDLVIFNLYSGEAEFFKIASPPAYLLRGERVSKLNGNSLPVGIISEVAAAVTSKKLRAEDQIILLTDGILNKLGEEEWLQEALPEIGALPPEQGAELLLELAEQTWGASDDRTVLILKVKEYH